MSRPKCTKCETNFAKPGEELCRTCTGRDPIPRAAVKGTGNPNPKCSFVYEGGRKCQKFSVKDSVDLYGKPWCLKHMPDQLEAARRKKDRELAKAIPDDRMRAIATGELSVEDLDDEELLRGQTRDRRGGFGYKPPLAIPKVVYDKMVQEVFKRADRKLQQSLLDVVEQMIRIATSEMAEDKDKLKAGMWIFERLRGKVPDNVVLSTDKPFQQVLEGIFAGPRTAGATALEPSYIDAEVVEDDDE